MILTIGQGAIHAGGLRHLPDVVRGLSRTFSSKGWWDPSYMTEVNPARRHHPFEENVRESRAVVRAAHAAGISVECELGAISGVEDGMSHSGANLVDLFPSPAPGRRSLPRHTWRRYPGFPRRTPGPP